MVGDAHKLIVFVSMTGTKYPEGMTLLNERCENMRCIVQAHLIDFWMQSSMRSISAVGLQQTLETTNLQSRVREFADLGDRIESWESSLMIFNHVGKGSWLIRRLFC